MRFEKVSVKEQKKFLEQFFVSRSSKVNSALEYIDKELVLPARSSAKSCGYDFRLPVDVEIQPNSQVLIPTFIKAAIDDDKVLELYPRSSYGIKKGLELANTVGVIDADYYNNEDNEGHIMVCMRNTTSKPVHLECGDKFVQGIIKRYFLMDGDEYGVGKARKGGIGSSGK